MILIKDKLSSLNIESRMIIDGQYKNLGIDLGRNVRFTPPTENYFQIIRSVFSYFFGFKSKFRLSSDDITKDASSFSIFYNGHPLNFFYARSLKLNGARTILFLHEPFMPNKTKYGFKKFITITIIELIQYISFYAMDEIICPSKVAFNEFSKKYPKFKDKVRVIPLMVPPTEATHCDKKFFTIIGNDHPAKNYDTFFNLVKMSYQRGLDNQFCIVTRSDISSRLSSLSEEEKRNLKVINKNVITDEEIDSLIGQSWAVFKLDKAITQSGIVSLCFMKKTPVIVNAIEGFLQDVKDKETGVTINCENKDCLEEIIEGMNFIRNNVATIERNISQVYDQKWSPNNWEKHYSPVFLLD